MMIDDARINALIKRPEVVREFPMLLTMAQSGRPCCGRSERRSIAYNAIKSSLAAMPGPRKELFKKLVGADRCRVLYLSNNNVADVTF
jgi:hypothetical protein